MLTELCFFSVAGVVEIKIHLKKLFERVRDCRRRFE